MITDFRIWAKFWKPARFISPRELRFFAGNYEREITFQDILDKMNEKPNPAFVFQQFTGLIDIKKVKVYDGDLIKGDGYGPYRVFWQNGSWCSCCYSDAEPIGGYRTIEVVGHIFDGTEYEGVQ